MYTIGELAKLSGVTNRTLRYYDTIGLLKPSDVTQAGYRLYGDEAVDLLQQILYYREMDLSLDEIKSVIYADDFDILQALSKHLTHLSEERQRIEQLIVNVEKTIAHQKGEISMTNSEKFEAWKQEVVKENDETYGEEIRAKYGEDEVEASNRKLLNASQEDWSSIEVLNNRLNEKLVEATKIGDTTNPLAKEVVDLHRQFLVFYWPEGKYSKEMHINMVDMYVSDDRFKAYYDQITQGAAEFLQAAVKNNLA